MDLGILQQDVAAKIGADKTTVENWEQNRTQPSIAWMPRIIDFLGYAPYAPAKTLEDWVDIVRRNLGLTQAQVALRIGTDPGTLRKWLQRRGCSPPDLTKRIRAVLRRSEP